MNALVHPPRLCSSFSKPGVTGLAIAQRLSQRLPQQSTYLIERHAGPGEEIRYRLS